MGQLVPVRGLEAADTVRPPRSLQEAVQLLLDAGERVLPQVVDVTLLPLPPLLLGAQLRHLLLNGDLGQGHGQVHLRETGGWEVALDAARHAAGQTPGVPVRFGKRPGFRGSCWWWTLVWDKMQMLT